MQSITLRRQMQSVIRMRILFAANGTHKENVEKILKTKEENIFGCDSGYVISSRRLVFCYFYVLLDDIFYGQFY